ncbi:MAG TPA: 6-carboxytetrahydropterin synthase [Hyphomicrobiales bacterium]|nr:6-carboxytetrahydropterin synthase [Hyphomicrobiales bacterium]
MAEFAVEIRDHIMIAHSLANPAFGPAQGLHGATFIVDVTFFRDTLSECNIVVDIALAHETLKSVLSPLNYANLDERPETAGQITTTEFLCRYIFDRMAEAIRAGKLGPDGKALSCLRVTLHESHVARAWFEGKLPA